MPAVPPLDRVAAFDRNISRRVVARPGDGWRKVWIAIVHRASQTGSYGVGWVLLFAVVITLLDGVAVAALAAACVLGTLLINTGIKVLIRRPRPWFNPVGERPATYSFPSAHTSMAMVGASVISLVSPDLYLLWWGWAAVLAISRIILGMHYVGDVIGGVLLGLLLAQFVALPLMQALGAG